MSVFTTLVIFVIHTPLWVWALYALLLFLAFQRTRSSIMPLWRMLIMPIVVALLATSSFTGAGLDGLSGVTTGIAIGGAVGWRLERADAICRQPGGRVWLRGEWWSFFQLLLVLVLRYAMNAVRFVTPGLAVDPAWHLSTTFISAGLSAVFLGRTAARLRVYFSVARVAAS